MDNLGYLFYMKKILKLTETELIKLIKRIIKEQNTTSGPYRSLVEPLGDLFIVKLDRNMCMDQRREITRNQLSYATGSTCPDQFIMFPGNKFYVYKSEQGQLKMFTPERTQFALATNNRNGYNTEQDAKNAVSKIINPQGYTGRKVEKTNQGKVVSKYDKQGNLQQVKSKWNYVDPQGQLQKGRSTQRTGL